MKVSVLGCGALGQVIAGLIRENGIKPSVFDLTPKDGVTTTDLITCVTGAEVVFVCIPSFAVRECMHNLSELVKVGAIQDGTVVVNCSKGLETDTLGFLTDVIRKELGDAVVVAEWSGPAIASEIAKKIHTKVDVACDTDAGFEKVCQVLNTSYLTCMHAHDMHAVELGGVMKNIYALLCGIIDGVHAGTNTKAFLMTEGMYEMCELGVSLRSRRESFYGLSGLGDLLTTCMSEHSRNRRFGEALASGKGAAQAMDDLGMVAEGYYACKTIQELADREGVSLPLAHVLYEFLYEDLSLEELLERIVSGEVIALTT